ncbi:hypothetical protein JOD82_002274 [Paenibacillus sp. 1182]|uniref:hypothetical protein n=1 Tax=Paenibacillus sp. 1182 TaxID=2806565 RepID=UPI001AE7E93C|nr:hypothetical protein [Paenibacillus sp. 1182]MBP1309254.1 hypothetical protein [Paenibacillus sp. 1182]
MIYINLIYVHYNSEDKTWASELLWDSLQKDQSRKAEGKIKGDFFGAISTHYFEKSLQVAVEAVYQLAKAFGIAESNGFAAPVICYTEEPELLDKFPCSDEIEEMIELENRRRGWVN